MELANNDKKLSIEEKLPVFLNAAMGHSYNAFEVTTKLSELVEVMIIKAKYHRLAHES